MQTTFDNNFWSFTYLPIARLIWLKRTSAPFRAEEEIRGAFRELSTALSVLPRADLKLLIDLRGGPAARNDRLFEVLLAPYRRSIPSGFRQSAVLLKSAVGKLQVKRYHREDGDGPPIFVTQEEALAHLGFPIKPNGEPGSPR
jgi:hypothetical protein